MDGFFLSVAAFFVVLIPLVIIHELGHFFAAKQVGITVLEFGVGMPPRALKLFTIGDTEYTLNWLPLGGFVRPFGEDFVRPKDSEGMKADLEEIEGRHIENPKSVFDAGPWERMWFMFAGPLANFVAAFIVFIIVALLGEPYRVYNVNVVQVFDDSPADVAGLQNGDVIKSVDGQKIETIDDFNDATRNKASFSLLIERDGAELPEPIVVTPTPFSIEPEIDKRVIVSRVDANSLADEAGLLADDVIVSINGETVTDRRMLLDTLNAVPVESPIKLEVRRKGMEIKSVDIPSRATSTSIGIHVTEFAAEIVSQVVIADIIKDNPAHKAGVEFDDVVVSVNGEPVSEKNMLVDYVGEREGREILFGIQRKGGEFIELPIVPEVPEGSEDGKAKIGIYIEDAPLNKSLGATIGELDPVTKTRPAGLFEAVEISANKFVTVMGFIVLAPVKIINGEIRGDAARPASPVAISQIGGEVLRQSQEEGEAYPILQFIALISIALAVTNLLPIPGLDGGRIVFVIIELLRGKPMAPEREGFVHMIGILFLLSLVVVVIAWDLIDPINFSTGR